MRFHKLGLFLTVITLGVAASAQDNQSSLDSFSAKFISSIRMNEKPKAFLITDRSVFSAGEYAWFRAFLLNTVSQKQSTRSKFLFVDLVDEDDNVINRVILDAENKHLNSRIQFPDSLATGYYWMRAYTKQMAELDTNDVYIKPLYVLAKDGNNSSPKIKKTGPVQDNAPFITFYPEGGNIITGINSTIGLYAGFKNGAPLSVEGVIKDNRDTIVAKFATNQYGLAKFEFEPSGYRKYKAVINWQGKDTGFALPAFDFFKAQLSATKQSDGFELRILLGDSIYTKDVLTYIAGVSKDSLVFASIGHGQYEVNVYENRLPQGITTFYLFDKDFKPLSERSIYVKENNIIAGATDKTMYAKQEKVSFDLAITNAQHQAIPSLLTVSVSDSIFNQITAPCNPDNVHYNFQQVDNLFIAANGCVDEETIDLLMLAKNSNYQTLTKATGVTANAYDSLLYISGRVVNTKNEPEANRMVTLLSSSGSGVFLVDTTDITGHFTFPLDTYPDSTQFAIEIKDISNHVLNSEVILDTIIFPHFTTPVGLKKYPAMSKTVQERLNTYNKYQNSETEEHHLPPVMVKDEIKDYDESKRVSPYSSILTSKDLDGRLTVDNAILKVSGFQLMNGYLVLRGLNALTPPGPSSEPLLLVDGVQVVMSPDGVGNVSPLISYLHVLNPKDIDFIEVLKDGNSAYYGVRGANGVILINLTNKGREIVSTSKSMKTFYVKGVARYYLFPVPAYDTKNKKTGWSTDDRSTIFWNGNFLTPNTGNSTFTFYTTDVPSTYNITVCGISANGDIIYKTFSFKSR